MNAPDYVEPTIGWRAWSITQDERQVRLSSPTTLQIWPPGVPFVAHCLMNRDHLAPAERCSCGVYAVRDVHYAVGYPRAWNGVVLYPALGRVSLWGVVVECERGWRASHAYPERILLPVRPGAEASEELDALTAALSVYGVPVLPLVSPWFRDASAWRRPWDDDPPKAA